MAARRKRFEALIERLRSDFPDWSAFDVAKRLSVSEEQVLAASPCGAVRVPHPQIEALLEELSAIPGPLTLQIRNDHAIVRVSVPSLAPQRELGGAWQVSGPSSKVRLEVSKFESAFFIEAERGVEFFNRRGRGVVSVLLEDQGRFDRLRRRFGVPGWRNKKR